jgi:hypothetical protein
MTDPIDSAELLTYLRRQADYCAEHGSPMYGVLGHWIADDVVAGGRSAALLARWIGPSVTEATVAADVPALRLLGALHRLVLERRAPELALFFPSVGGSADIRTARPVLLATMAEHVDVLQAGMGQVPQTNEVGRASALLGGLRHVAAWSRGRPVRLHEIGASAGLNLRADRLPVGPGELIDTPLPLPEAPAFEVVERIGGDLHPVDPTTTEGRLLLTSYVWPDDVQRLERLRAALAVAEEEPVQLLRIGAADLVESIELRPGMVTVLWHSVMWQYLDASERRRVLAAVDRLASVATSTSSFAYIRFEATAVIVPDQPQHHEVRLSAWPDAPGERLLGVANAHGVPVRWLDGP